MTAAGFEIAVLEIPEGTGAPGFADFAEMTRVRNAIETQVMGTDVLNYAPEDLLPHWLKPYDDRVLLVARVEGRIVGRAIFSAPTEEGSTEAWFVVEVLEGFRRRGIGTALYDRLTALAIEAGRGDVW